MRECIVYGLYDSRDGELRYIGKSSIGLRRLQRHMWEARNSRGSNPYKVRWIRSLLARGQAPIILALTECSSSPEAAESERVWIAAARAVGARLTNLTDGGEGSQGYKHTADAIEKCRAAHVGRPNSLEARQKMSKAHQSVPWTETQRKANEAIWMNSEMLASHAERRRAWAATPDGRAWAGRISKVHRGRRHAPAGVASMARKHQKPVIDQHGTIYPSQLAAADSLGVKASNISHMLAGRRIHVKGYVFSFMLGMNGSH